MNRSPIICFGQQPCGFFPRRFFYAKIQTARHLQKELGGEIVYFCHDSDHDPRETRTLLRHPKTGAIWPLNFMFENQVQRLYSPLFCKRIAEHWQAKAAQQIREYVAPRLIEIFINNKARDAAGFCLEMYRHMGLLDGIRVACSSDPEFRRKACDIADYFVDVPYSGEVVRARHIDGALKLHKGGDSYITLPPTKFTKEQISPTRDTRLRWMQSVIRCTHYVSGAGEQAYLAREDAPEITYVDREPIERHNEAYTELTA